MRNSSARVRRRKQRIAEMNVVPYIDVMLVLLIIFMTTSTFISEEKKLELPFSSTGKSLSDNPSVDISEQSNYILKESQRPNIKGKPVASFEEMLPTLKALKNKSKNPQEFRVLLNASPKIEYGKVWELKERFKNEGLDVSLVTKKK